jgi:hypothetical protein
MAGVLARRKKPQAGGTGLSPAVTAHEPVGSAATPVRVRTGTHPGTMARSALPVSNDRTLFHEPWWLDAATNGDWHQVEVTRDGLVVGWLPFTHESRAGTVSLEMPPYSRVLGPLLSLPESKPVRRLANVRSIVAELISKLPLHGRFRQYLPPSATEIAFAFKLNGWIIDQRFTFQIDPTNSLSSIWTGMSDKTRNVIRTGRKRFPLEHHRDIDRYLVLSHAQMQQQRRANRHDYGMLVRLFEASARRDQSIILTARLENGRDAASAILVWDNTTLYFWNAARDTLAAGNTAYSGLIWAAIQFAHERGLVFDFDGFSSPSSAMHLASFGGSLAVRPCVTNRSLVSRALILTRDIGRAAMRSEKRMDQNP